MKTVFYKEIGLDILEQVYEPREDSMLLAEQVEKEVEGKKLSVLDIGTGSGLQAIIASQKGSVVTATDINPIALDCAKSNAEKNGVEIEFLLGDLFEPLNSEPRLHGSTAPLNKFDLIIFNAPYLKEEGAPAEKELIDHSYAGAGKIKEFLEQYKNFLKPGGFALLVHNSLSGVEVSGEIIASKKVAFEEIFVSKPV